VSHAYVGLSEQGNREIEAMRQDGFDERMACWKGWLVEHRDGANETPWRLVSPRTVPVRGRPAARARGA